jgi:hypothetical protein
MTGPTSGARFTQTKPVQGAATGGQSPSVLPHTLLTVPAGSTYTLKDASISLAMATDSTFSPAATGGFATIQDSIGNTWAECECAVAGTGQTATNGEVRSDIFAQLPAGTVVTINIAGAAATPPTGLTVRVGGGITWNPA